MKIQPMTLQTTLEWLQKRAASGQTALVVELRIAVTPRRAQFLEIKAYQPLATIHF